MTANRPAPRSRLLAFGRTIVTPLVTIAIASLFFVLTPRPSVVERDYSNGVYPSIDRAVRTVTGPLPFAAGDVLAVLTAAALVTLAVRSVRALRRRGVTGWGVTGLVVRDLLGLVAIASVVGAWFLVSWGYGYSRVSLADKVPVHDERTNEDTVTAYADHVVDELNANAAPAHAEISMDLPTLQRTLAPTWEKTIHRLGDVASFAPYAPKPTIFAGFMEMSGTTGFTDPWTHEVNLSPLLFPYERPAIFAHEWSHLAGFSDETEANYIAVIACTISKDPLLRYSGWMLIWFNLPADLHPTHRFTQQPYDDVVAVRNRYLANVKPAVQHVATGAYDHYLRANHVKAGYGSYRLFVRWLTGADYDAEGLPVVRPGTAEGSARSAT